MSLQRYNQIVFAVLSTLALLGFTVLAIIDLSETFMTNRPRGVVIDRKNNKPHAAQNLFFCLPITFEGSGFEYIPIGTVVARDSDEDPFVRVAHKYASVTLSNDENSLDSCPGVGNGHLFNVMIRNIVTGEQHLLLSEPAVIRSLKGPTAKCGIGEGSMPCDRLLWLMRAKDSNGDGVINGEDATVAYGSDFAATELTQITPLNATVVSTIWLPKSRHLAFEIRTDTNKDKFYTEEDGSELIETDALNPSIAQPVFKRPILERLKEAIK